MAKVFTITEGIENMGALKSGGQGSVYKARRIGEIISAVKMLPTPVFTESSADKNYADFLNEVEKLKRVNEQPNPHVVSILSHGITESGSFPFIEMEFIEGPDLEELLQPPHDPVFTIKEAIKLAIQLASALAHCHRVEVKHGDIKSNNVKYNSRTGNYMLLDFGLALLSDEVRRTSLRRAGSVEFMAPEQSDGKLLFQSDIYGFGVILFELLAGTVPFPLADNSETARNTVMLAQRETAPPDILMLRNEHLPVSWDEERATLEMGVPPWLLDIVYKCLEKDPVQRFANGEALLEAICAQDTRPQDLQGAALNRLQAEHNRLQQKNQALQQMLGRQGGLRGLAGGRPGVVVAALIALLSVLALLAFLFWPKYGRNELSLNEPKAVQPKATLGQYKVAAPRAYFFSRASEGSRLAAYLVPSGNVLTAQQEANGFIYTEFTSSNNKVVKGWLRRQDLLALADPAGADTTRANGSQTNPEVAARLQYAQEAMASGQQGRALLVYDSLAKLEVPEAMYAYGNLAMQNRNSAIDCKRAYELVYQASRNNYTPAKATIGFLYAFAGDNNALQSAGYTRCAYRQNMARGAQLLMEATLEGDSTARRWLKELNRRQPAEQLQ